MFTVIILYVMLLLICYMFYISLYNVIMLILFLAWCNFDLQNERCKMSNPSYIKNINILHGILIPYIIVTYNIKNINVEYS